MTETECAICMESVDYRRNFVVTKCGHGFHFNCLMKNIAYQNKSCPMCRANIIANLELREGDLIRESQMRINNARINNAFDIYLYGVLCIIVVTLVFIFYKLVITPSGCKNMCKK